MDIVQKFRKSGVRHFTQIDPANENPEKLLRLVGESGTDAIIYAGTEGVTSNNLLSVLKRSKHIRQMKIVAPSSPEIVDVKKVCKKILYSDPPLADAILPYVVLNSTDPRFVNIPHGKWYSDWFEEGEKIPIDRIRELPYIIISQESTVRKKVPIDEDFSLRNIVGYATVGAMRSCMHGIPVLYLETTGYDKSTTNIEPADYVHACSKWVREMFPKLFLISGGNIRSEEEARKRIEAGADAINVGNPLYFEDKVLGHSIYLSTVRGVKPHITLEEHEKLYKRLYSTSLVR